MIYTITIKLSVAKALTKIDAPQRKRLIEAIDKLKINPTAGSVLKGEISGLRRIRIGDYRIGYEMQNEQLVILVVRIAHRGEVYK